MSVVLPEAGVVVDPNADELRKLAWHSWELGGTWAFADWNGCTWVVPPHYPPFVATGNCLEFVRLARASVDPTPPIPKGHAAAYWFGQLFGEFHARNADFGRVAEQVCGTEIGASYTGFQAILYKLCEHVAAGGRIKLEPAGDPTP